MHRAAGLVSPTAMQPVKLALRRMARAKVTRQRQAEPLNRPALDRMLAAAGQGPEPSVIDLRDAALAAVAYDTLLRRSELVSLYIEDLAPATGDGTTILVRKSKTDQGGEGVVKFLAPDTVRAVRVYLDAIGAPTDGPLFRPVTRWGRAGPKPLEGQEVPRIFRKLAGAAGVTTARLHSGHLTRVGAAQDMLAAGLELGEVMQAGSWKSVAMVARYGERLLARRGAARKLAVLQNRA
jgi:integrase